LEATELAQALRGSAWAYLLVNAGHIFGVALLVGGIVPLDLRLMGLWRSLPLVPLWQVLTRTAAVGLLLAVVCGTLLFSTRAAAYVQSSLFIFKMLLVAVGLANAAALHLAGFRRLQGLPPTGSNMPMRIRIAAGISLTAWLTALVLGRLVGYF
jgi:hypothetical protein